MVFLQESLGKPCQILNALARLQPLGESLTVEPDQRCGAGELGADILARLP